MPLSAEERLILVQVKIKRAAKHLAEIEGTAEQYRDSYASVGIVGMDLGFSQGAPNLVKFPIIRVEMLAMVGDVLHNLRSALDHIIYNLVLVANPTAGNSVLEKVSFPIGRSSKQYHSVLRKRIEAVIERRALQFIDGLKPYKGGSFELWNLHELNNIDKHRKLIAVAPDILCEGDGFFGHYWIKSEKTDFATVTADKTSGSKALIPTLHQLTDFVKILVEQFKPFLQPLEQPESRKQGTS